MDADLDVINEIDKLNNLSSNHVYLYLFIFTNKIKIITWKYCYFLPEHLLCKLCYNVILLKKYAVLNNLKVFYKYKLNKK